MEIYVVIAGYNYESYTMLKAFSVESEAVSYVKSIDNPDSPNWCGSTTYDYIDIKKLELQSTS